MNSLVRLHIPPSEAGRAFEATDWSRTQLGPTAGWPLSLIVTVNTLLASRHPMFLWWGEDLIQVYNDAYLPSIRGGKHPGAMGQAGRACWPEIWPIIGPQIASVMTDGAATWHEEALVSTERNGGMEEVFWTYGYSPVRREDGLVGGTLVVCTETTSGVLAIRRAAATRMIQLAMSGTESSDEIHLRFARELGRLAVDVPFSILCVAEHSAAPLRVVAATGLEGSVSASLARLAKSGAKLPPLLVPFVASHQAQLVALPSEFGPWPGGPWPEPSRLALVVPTVPQTEDGHAERVVAVLGISPRLPFDRPYREFFEGATEELGAALRRSHLAIVQSRMEQELQRAGRLASITTLAGGAAHEINNPLAVVIANLSAIATGLRPIVEGVLALAPLATRGTLAEELIDLEAATSEAIEGAQRVGRIVSDLQAFSGNGAMVQVPVDTVKVMSAALDRASASIQQRAHLVRHFTDVPFVLGTELQLRNVFASLLKNALEAIPPGKPERHEILVSIVASTPQEVEILIRDSGQGIEPAALPHIFDPFFTTRDVGKGAGLGLSVSLGIVEDLGGKIRVDSVVGVGTAVTVTIPAAGADAR